MQPMTALLATSLILRCDRILPMEIRLPKGYSIRTLAAPTQQEWMKLEQDRLTLSYVCGEDEWGLPPLRFYATIPGEFLVLAESPEGHVVGAAVVGSHDPRGDGIRAIHFVAVQKAYRRKGLGRALCQTAMALFRREDNSLPVWAHASHIYPDFVMLCVSLGFRLQPTDTFYDLKNQYEETMAYFRRSLKAEQYAKLEAASAQNVRTADISAIRYDARGLVPAIAQDAYTGEVLMQAYMNEESLQETLASGYATYWSRSRNELWRKGATSGNLQRVIRLSYDCDADSILMQVESKGPACHTGARSCFFNPVMDGDMPATAAILETIEKTVADRAANPKPGSYTNYLLDKGAEKIGKKVGEEATEAVIAAIKGDADGLAGEAADLLYHLTVLLYQQGVPLRDVWEVLKKRHT